MLSPFPGMDPYLESPDIWPDFHDALASEIRTVLNHALPAPYYARLEMRPEIGIVEDEDTRRRIVPDIAVIRHPAGASRESAGTAVLDQPRVEIAQSFEVKIANEPVRHHFVEIRDPARSHKLITLIEIVGPSNKHRGADHDAYVRKQREVLDSDASLMEIDLLRAGGRLVPNVFLVAFLDKLEPPPAYVILINRAWQREGETAYQIFPIGMREPLPCVPVPLKQGEAEAPLDLQYVFNRAYAGGPYRRGAVNYAAPPNPPLAAADAVWAGALLPTSVA